MKSDRKPPLVKSPLRLRPRRVIRSGATPMRTPLPASSTKSRIGRLQESGGVRPEYLTISTEIKALEKMVQEELGKSCSNGLGLGGFSAAGPRSAFERGRYYDEYSARRNERLKRKLSLGADENQEPKTAYNPMAYNQASAMESAKKQETNTKKRTSTVKKSIQETPACNLGDRSEHPRYSLRSMKKPPLPVSMTVENSAMVGDRKARPPRARRN